MNIPQPSDIEKWWLEAWSWFKVAPFQNIIVVCFIVFLIVWFRNPSILGSIRNGIIDGVRYLFGSRKRVSLQRKITTQLNDKIKKLRTESGIAGFTDLPDLGVKYVNVDGRVSAFDNGEITVFWRNADVDASRPENVVKTAMAYVKEGMYPSVRPYISEKASTALDLVLMGSFVEDDEHALSYFANQVIGQQLRADAELQKKFQAFSRIYGGGLLHNMLLHQLALLPEKAFSDAYSPEIISESEDFVTFVANLAARPKGESVELAFSREFIKVAICLLGRDETLQRGYTPYLRYLYRRIQAGYRSYYVLAAGRKIENIEEYLRTIIGNHWYNQRVVTQGCEVKITKPRTEDEAEQGVLYLQLLPYVGEDAPPDFVSS